ncbi:outer membrane protein assembly factor BamA [Thermodesulfobacteriota bacterium]
MDRFSKSDGDRQIQKDHNMMKLERVNILRSILIIVLCLLIPAMVQAQEKKKVAVLPFRIHSLEPLDHLKAGLQKMIATRVAEQGYNVINPEVVNRHPMAFMPAFETKDIIALGKELDSDWVIHGSLTQIGRKVSLDVKVVDTSGVKSPFSIFMVDDDIDRLTDTANRVALSIDNQISGVVQIDTVRVYGNRRIEADAILAVIESRKGERLDQKKLDKDLRAIYKMGYFRDVSIETEDGPNGKIINFKVTEKPSIVAITFKGNKKIQDKKLSEELGIKIYSILDRNEVKQSVNRLMEHYRKEGYYNVEIKEQIKELPNNAVSLNYVIDDGEKVYITKIEFVGNTIFDDGDLKDIMETSEKGFLSWITGSGLLDKKKLEFDIQKITAFYHNHGYVRAKAGEPKITYEEGKGLTITIDVIEGHQYKVNAVRIEGDMIKSAKELLGNIKLKKGIPIKREIVHNDILTLKKIHADEGYAYSEIIPVTKQDDKDYLVDVTYNISKNKRVSFERINITGNTVTRDKVIRREIKVMEGSYYSGTDLRKSTRNLSRLGFFEDVEFKTKKGSRDDLMILDVGVKERPTGVFSIGMGYSSFDKAFGTFNVAQNNLFGKGQKLNFNTILGSRTTQFNISFTEPWLLDKPISSTIDMYKWETEYDVYVKDSLGGALGFGFPLNIDEYTRGSVRYEYDNADITDIDPSASLTIQDLAGKNIKSSVTLGVNRNSKDKPWNASEGSNNSLSMEYAGGIFGGDIYFTKYQARSAWYFPMMWQTVFLIQGRAGYVTERSGGKLPVYEKFTLGGINSVRGYEYGTISPIDPATGDEIGGEKMWVYNIEYRFPLLKEQGVVGLVFFDAGNVFTKEEDFEFKAKRSYGAGVRWYSPIGPLRLEYGRKLDEVPGDDSAGGYEFSVGGTF